MLNTRHEQRRREALARQPRGPAPPDAAADAMRALYADGIEWTLLARGVALADARRASMMVRSPASDERLRHCLVVQAPGGWQVLPDVNHTTLAAQDELRALRRRGAQVKSLFDLLRERGWPERLAA